jgi:hypothetical protein
MPTPLLGYIARKDRTLALQRKRDDILTKMPRFRILNARSFPKDVKRVNLYDCWSDLRVVKAVGFKFTRFHQLTGSCVGASGGNVAFTLAACQVVLQNAPEMAVVPFWMFDYGIGRKDEGMSGQGCGSDTPGEAQAVQQNGIVDAKSNGLPPYTANDPNGGGITYTSDLEIQWSNGDYCLGQADAVNLGKKHLVKTVSPVNDVNGIRQAIQNGYPVHTGCDNYIRNASVQGSGADACVVGTFDKIGGHATSLIAWWDNPTLGPLYLYLNNWPDDAYPQDPAGAPICSCWIKEADLTSAFSNLGLEAYPWSHEDGYPAQTLDWLI